MAPKSKKFERKTGESEKFVISREVYNEIEGLNLRRWYTTDGGNSWLPGKQGLWVTKIEEQIFLLNALKELVGETIDLVEAKA